MRLKLENFDGPLDLLLYLIQSQEINIFNIPIILIAEQFNSFLTQTHELDYQVAGEYLLMASQLIEIKAHMLLPVANKELASADKDKDIKNVDDIPEGDPRKALVKQLIEFETLKKASEILASMETRQREIFPSNEHKRREEEFAQLEHPIKGNSLDLLIAFERVLLKFSHNNTLPKVTVRAQKITIQHKIVYIKNKLEESLLLTLVDLIQECIDRYEMCVTLMALLELCQTHEIQVCQENLFGEIQITQGASVA